MTANRILDKLFLTSDAWWIKLIWNRWTRAITLLIIRNLPIVKGRVLFVSRAGEHYSCNPRAIAEYIVNNYEEYNLLEPWFLLKNPSLFQDQINGLNIVQPKTLIYYYIYSTSQFILCNQIVWDMEPKRKRQIYIQTLHGGHGIKKFALDSENDCSDKNRMLIKEVASMTDLALSDSDYFTNIIRRACALSCEILQKGLPRNDIFFSSRENLIAIKKAFLHRYNLSPNNKYVIYAPTYRDIEDLSIYGFDTDSVLSALSKRFGGDWYILVSSHPYMLSVYRSIYDFSSPKLIDIGQLPDVQELLIAGDALITDYSSIEMDFSLTGRPIFQLAKDWRHYSRGTYIDVHSLPFPFAEDDRQLCENIMNFDEKKYAKNLAIFNQKTIGLCETGVASKAVADWMLKRIS